MVINAPSLANIPLLDFPGQVQELYDAGVRFFHVDIMDGHYVPNLCFPASLVGELKEKYGIKYPHIKILPPNYDLDILYTLRSHCGLYIHGHSAGGTNPSLVEAMFFGCPIMAFDVVYNRETTHNQARYFKNVQELTNLLKSAKQGGLAMKEIAEKEYTWKHIAEQYCRLYNK